MAWDSHIFTVAAGGSLHSIHLPTDGQGLKLGQMKSCRWKVEIMQTMPMFDLFGQCVLPSHDSFFSL